MNFVATKWVWPKVQNAAFDRGLPAPWQILLLTHLKHVCVIADLVLKEMLF